MDTKRLRERTDVLSFFINILILERGSGMKSYSNFIIEKKRGTAVASPAPGDPLDPKGRKKIEKKFSNPSNPPKVKNPEASKPTPKPEGVKQADVSKKAANYRRAERVKGATGGKTTGSLSKGNLSFPGDRSGATAKAKSDIEARKGFSGSKSGGLKADESNPNVNRAVRQQRTVKQGTPDPFDPKAPKAPARPFKSLVKGKKTVLPSIPDPFKSATSDPKKITPPKPKASSVPGPATSQAIKDIRSSMSRRGVKTTEADVAQRYMRKMQDTGRSIDPDLVGAQGVKASGAKPEMIGGKTAPKGSYAKFRAQADATKDISKAKSADLDKALKNLVNSGDVKKSKPSGPSSSIGFKQFSMKADKIAQKTKASRAAGYSTTNRPKPGSQVVKVSTPPKASAPKSNALDLGSIKDYKTPSFSDGTGSQLSKKSWGQLNVDIGRKGGLSKADDIIDVDVKVDPPTKKPKALPGTAKPPKPSSVKLPPAKKTPALAAASKSAPVTQASLNKTLRGIGGRALGLAGAGYDAVSSYQEYKKRGDSNVRAGLKSAFRTGLGYAGGALGGLAGAVGGGGVASAVTGTAGAIGGYSAGTWLADKVLGRLRPERQRRAKAAAAKK